MTRETIPFFGLLCGDDGSGERQIQPRPPRGLRVAGVGSGRVPPGEKARERHNCRAEPLWARGGRADFYSPGSIHGGRKHCIIPKL